MTLGNMRENGVHHLIAYCLNDSCRHQAIIDVSSYPGETEIPWFQGKVKCGKCGARGRHIDVRPNWKEASRVDRLAWATRLCRSGASGAHLSQ
jgi:transposase